MYRKIIILHLEINSQYLAIRGDTLVCSPGSVSSSGSSLSLPRLTVLTLTFTAAEREPPPSRLQAPASRSVPSTHPACCSSWWCAGTAGAGAGPRILRCCCRCGRSVLLSCWDRESPLLCVWIPSAAPGLQCRETESKFTLPATARTAPLTNSSHRGTSGQRQCDVSHRVHLRRDLWKLS